jgi:hypothetical protein
MDLWEKALNRASQTGYWKDAEACARVCEAYGDEVNEWLKTGKFSGDSERALQAWTNLCATETEYREALTREARLTAPAPDPSCWWMVLECNPDANAEEVKTAFREKMKECHPDRVEGMAPQIKALANDMAQRLTRAMQEFEAKSG